MQTEAHCLSHAAVTIAIRCGREQLRQTAPAQRYMPCVMIAADEP